MVGPDRRQRRRAQQRQLQHRPRGRPGRGRRADRGGRDRPRVLPQRRLLPGHDRRPGWPWTRTACTAGPRSSGAGARSGPGVRYLWATPVLRSTVLLVAVVGMFGLNYRGPCRCWPGSPRRRSRRLRGPWPPSWPPARSWAPWPWPAGAAPRGCCWSGRRGRLRPAVVRRRRRPHHPGRGGGPVPHRGGQPGLRGHRQLHRPARLRPGEARPRHEPVRPRPARLQPPSGLLSGWLAGQFGPRSILLPSGVSCVPAAARASLHRLHPDRALPALPGDAERAA